MGGCIIFVMYTSSSFASAYNTVSSIMAEYYVYVINTFFYFIISYLKNKSNIWLLTKCNKKGALFWLFALRLTIEAGCTSAYCPGFKFRPTASLKDDRTKT